MTNRYVLLLASIASSDRFIVQMFLYAFFAVLAYNVLEWLPIFWRRPIQYLYLIFGLAAFLFTIIYSCVYS